MKKEPISSRTIDQPSFPFPNFALNVFSKISLVCLALSPFWLQAGVMENYIPHDVPKEAEQVPLELNLPFLEHHEVSIEAEQDLTTSEQPSSQTFEEEQDLLSSSHEMESSYEEPLELNSPDQILVSCMKGLILLDSPEYSRHHVQEDVNGVVLEGLSPPGSSKCFKECLAPYIIGQPLTQQKISQLKQQIISYYRKHHRPVVLVLVPEQDVSDGVLQLVVVEGRVGDVIVKGQRYFSESSIRSEIDLESGDTINSDLLLTNIAWLNQNPFRQTNVVLTPGVKNGTTNIELITRDRLPIRLYVGVDNTGNPFTGKGRLFTGFNWGNAFGVGHLMSFQYTTSEDLHTFRAYTASYSAPLPWYDTLTVYGGYTEVKPGLRGLKSEGWSGQVSVRYKIPIGKLYSTVQQNIQYGYDFKETNNNLEMADRRSEAIQTHVVQLGQFLVGYHLSYLPRRHIFNFETNVYFSPAQGLYSHQTTANYKLLQPGASPIYFYTQLTISEEYRSRSGWKVFFEARGQASNKTLLPSEQFGLGGYNTVRGYLERIVNYDNAVCANFEIKSPSAAPWQLLTGKNINENLYILAFADFGYGTPHQQIARASRLLDSGNQTLLSVGPGLRYNIIPYITIRFDLGFPLTKVEHNGTHARSHFSVILSY